MKVRPATLSDAPAVTALWNSMIRETLATFTTEEKLFTDLEAMITARSHAFWVAEGSTGVLGFVTYGPFRGGPGYAATAEHTIILGPEAQGQGLGRALLDHALSAARAQDLHVMIAGISSANPRAVDFHAAMGFVKTAHMPEVGRKQGQWLDLILMQKTL